MSVGFKFPQTLRYHGTNGAQKEKKIMLYIQKGKEPQFLTDFRKKYPKKDYDRNEFSEYRLKLRKQLVEEQKGLCA